MVWTGSAEARSERRGSPHERSFCMIQLPQK
jgi:hypothetical protein